jgi:hypothetical protein
MPIHHKVSLVSLAVFLEEANNLQLSKRVQKEAAAAPNVLPSARSAEVGSAVTAG